MNRRIVYTRNKDGGVSVCKPTAEIFRVMQMGGYWNDRPRGFVEAQIERQISAGIAPDAARRFAHAVAFGGCTEAEVWEIIRDRDTGHLGMLHELQNADDFPDRWFRNAWARSHNGGPIGVDMERARPLQWERAHRAAERENARRSAAFDARPQVAVAWETLRAAMRHARDADELRRVWPEEIPLTL